MYENILIIACTQKSATAWLENAKQDIGQTSLFKTIILENLGGDFSSIKTVLSDQNNIAVVLIIDKDWLAEQDFLTLVSILLRKISSREDFRFYVFLADLSLQEFNQITESPKADILGDLVDTVQLSQFNDANQVIEQLKEYKKQHRNIRLGMLGKKIRIAAANITIFSGTIIQLICLAAAALFISLYFLKWNLTFLETLGSPFSLAAGIIVFPIILYIIYIISNLAEAGKYLFNMFIGLGLIVLGIWVVKDIAGATPIYIISIFFGIVLEYFRRASYNDRRLLTRIDINNVTHPHQELPISVRNTINGANTNPFSCPFSTDQRPILFLSYTRRSEWGKKLALKLNNKFRLLQSESFLDVADIPTGSNWRQTLNSGFGKANVFISLIDEFSLERSWPAAELECALRVEGKYAIPRIIVLKKQDLDIGKAAGILPVFSEVLSLSPEAITPLQPSIIEIKGDEDTKIDILTSQLHFPEFHTPSVIPREVSALVQSPFLFLLKPLGYFFLIACNIGWLPGFLSLIFPEVNKFVINLANTTWRIPSLIILGYLSGAIFRYMFTLYFEEKLSFIHWRFIPYSLLGIIDLLYIIMQHAPLFDLAYPLLAGCIGWIYSMSLEYYTSHSKNPAMTDLSSL